MEGSLDVLVASSDIEERRALVKILDDLSLNVISCNALSQVAEVLSHQAIDLIFCDDYLIDGSYRDLLAINEEVSKSSRVVITIRTGDWKEYVEAMRLGAFDAVRRPWHPTDVELIVLHALHGCDKADQVAAKSI